LRRLSGIRQLLLSDDMKTFEEILKQAPQSVKSYYRLSMEIAAMVDDILKMKGWSQRDLADKMGKKESEISKFLAGNHNFTIKTIAKLEEVLREQLLFTNYDFRKPASDWVKFYIHDWRESWGSLKVTQYYDCFLKENIVSKQTRQSGEISNIAVNSEGELREMLV
jgi:transcriptional regulator with XRE-family HTH domain